jgi:hypothetical protein
MKNKKIFLSFLSLITGICKNMVCHFCQFFSGQMPANFSKEKMKKINNNDFFILEKSNGFRFLFLITPFLLGYFIDRNFSMHKTIYFKKKTFNYVKKGIIYDGEISFNLIKEDFDFIIYDVICYEDDWRVSTWDLTGRINILNHIKKQKELVNWEYNNFKKKDFFLKENLQILFEQIYSNIFSKDFVFLNRNIKKTFICNKNDGIIFAHSKSIYFSKNPTNIFKWKYEKDNSVDLLSKNFLIKLNKKKNSIIFEKLFCQGFGNNLILIKKEKKNFYFKRFCFFFIFKKKKKIREYILNKKRGKWINTKNRPDKQKPNSLKLIINTLESIVENFFKFELIDKFLKQNIRKNRGKNFYEEFFFFSGL